MSNTEDKPPIDSELKAYLAGEDGVSAAYRQAGAEEPPEELDRLILAAARNAVQKEKPSTVTSSRQKFSLAASFMVGVLVTSMYFNQESEFAETAATSAVLEEEIISQSIEQPAPAFAPAAPTVTTRDVQPPEPLAQEVTQQAARLGEQVARAVAPASSERQEASQNKAEADTAGVAPPGAETTRTDAVGEQLQEIMVTGSRVSSDSEVDLSYRQTREEWLMEILALRREVLDEEELLEELNGQLDEEAELYLEAYPGSDLDAELRALEE